MYQKQFLIKGILRSPTLIRDHGDPSKNQPTKYWTAMQIKSSGSVKLLWTTQRLEGPKQAPSNDTLVILLDTKLVST